MTEEAGAIAEVAKTTGEIVRAAGGLGAYLAGVFGSIPADTLGLLVGDWLAHKRRRHLTLLEANTARILESIASGRLSEPSPSVLIPLLQASVDEGRHELQALWAALLANAMVDGGKRVRRDYFEAVRQMEPVDARLLDLIRRFPPATEGGRNVALFDAIEKAGIGQPDLPIGIQKLSKLECVVSKPGGPVLMPFGKGLLEACSPP
jgi:hypothetical protein